jgi:hypothetical protein
MLESECQQHSNNRSSIMYGSNLGSICYTSIPRTSEEIWKGISGIYIYLFFALFKSFKSTLRLLLLDKSNMVVGGGWWLILSVQCMYSVHNVQYVKYIMVARIITLGYGVLLFGTVSITLV